MGRAPRLDPKNGWHHVMNRGAARQAVFFTAGNGRTFESMLADGYEQFGVELHAYCLMTNHFHLLVHCPDGALSTYMQRLSSNYTRYLNTRLGRDGPVFRGRFRSLLIDSERYLAFAGRYIHRNPLDVRPPVNLERYRWSSFRHYCGVVEPPSWLHLSELAGMHGSPSEHWEFVNGDADTRASGSFDWAIATAIAEAEDVSAPARARSVALVMLDMADPPVVGELETMLAFSTPAARRSALHRARTQLAQNPHLGALARRALELAA